MTSSEIGILGKPAGFIGQGCRLRPCIGLSTDAQDIVRWLTRTLQVVYFVAMEEMGTPRGIATFAPWLWLTVSEDQPRWVFSMMQQTIVAV